MYAIISDGGRQYTVKEGEILDVDYRDLSAGAELTFDRVLAVGEGEALTLGSPVVEGASVRAEVVGVEFGEKLTVQKFRRRKTFRRKTGHRQMFTRVKINQIAT